MKTLAVIAAGFLLSTSAYAAEHGMQLADNQWEHHTQGGQHTPPPGSHPGGGTPNQYHPNPGNQPHGNFQGMQGQTHAIQPHNNWQGMQGTSHGGGMQMHTHVNVNANIHPNYQHDSRGFGVRPDNWNQRPRTFDRATYQGAFTASHAFHWGIYRRPDGWYYRRWTYGDYLPPIFWARDYWIDSWWMFDLPVPPYGYEWVRYGDDALLIDTDTGQVLEVEYGVFD